jgi:hypothetical protein
MNTLSSLCNRWLTSFRVGNRPSSTEAKTLRRPRLRVGLLIVVLCAALHPRANAQQPSQQQPERPFIEPTEMRHKAARKAAVTTQPAQTGRWDTLNQLMPINPVHVALMHNYKILVVSGSGNDPNNKNFQAGVWNIPSKTINTFPLAWDMFCNGMVILPDGRPFVLGGTLKYDNFLGEPRTSAFNPLTAQFVDTPQMNGGRWYPTGTVLGNGSVLAVSGLTNTSSTVNQSVQIWSGTQWTAAGTIFAGVPLYPRQHLLPNGKVFEDGANRNSKMYDPATHLWSDVATTIFPGSRDYGTSVLLPLSQANGYKPKVIVLGGANGSSAATDTTEVIDLSVNQPQWVNGPRMDRPRVQLNATILPDGKVLVSGGSVQSEVATTDSLSTQLYDPDSNSFSPAGSMEFPRLYHSNTILLPDATVMAVGGNPERTVYEPHIEIYSPPYLFNPDGSSASRPVITGVTPSVIRYGAPFRISTPAAASIKEVVLIRPGAVTHAFDMEQRLVRLYFTARYGVLSVATPANGNIAPPGYYMLFILNSAGVPSGARFVRLVMGNVYAPAPSRL